jgi:hypothetical protein
LVFGVMDLSLGFVYENQLDSGTESCVKIKNLHFLTAKCRFCRLFVCFVQFGARHHFYYRCISER